MICILIEVILLTDGNDRNGEVFGFNSNPHPDLTMDHQQSEAGVGHTDGPSNFLDFHLLLLHVTVSIVQIITVTQATKVSKVCGPIAGTFNSTDNFGR